jgi:hypothetical protein
MKNFACLAGCLLQLTITVFAQDEGIIKKRERIDRSKGVFVGGGGSFTLGKNIGDYSVGYNFEAGFLKRVNRVLSIGPSFSYLNFKYDPEVTNAERGAYYGNGDISVDWYSDTYETWGDKYPTTAGQTYDYAYVLTLDGGDLSLISLALNIKLNFIPITDNTKFSVYGFAKPFITMSRRDAVTGSGKRWVWESYEDRKGTAMEGDDVLYYYQGDEQWHADGYEEEWDSEGYPVLAEDNSVTGGVFLGPGIEFIPSKPVSIFVQAAFGYTFPISYVSTQSYDDTIESYIDDEFPMVKEGFSSLNFQVGVSYNF